VQNTLKEIGGAMKEGVEFDIHLPKSSIMVHADKQKLKHVIINLLDNAIKYTGKGKIELRLEKKSEKARLMIKDSGIGISAEAIGSLFNKFVRAANATKVNSVGTGLGLYVVKKIIESHHGKVWVESEGEGKGSEFYVELPTL
jgi:signal transduction histidine kinase